MEYIVGQGRKFLENRSTHRSKFRGVINGKAGKAAALPKFSNLLTLSQTKVTLKLMIIPAYG